jgi:hypothetical protein
MHTGELVTLHGWKFDLSTYEDRDDFTHTVWHDVFIHYDKGFALAGPTTEYAVAAANRVESAAKVLWDINQ